MFEFMAENTDVEFGLVQAEKGAKTKSYIGTNNDPTNVQIGILLKDALDDEMTITEENHSHPGYPNIDIRTPSGFDPETQKPKASLEGDRKVSAKLQEMLGADIKQRLYIPQLPGLYIRYDSKKIYPYAF